LPACSHVGVAVCRMPRAMGDTLKSVPFSAIANHVAHEIAALDPSYRSRLAPAGFDARPLLQPAGTLAPETRAAYAAPRHARTRVDQARPAGPEEILTASAPGSPEEKHFAALGTNALKRGEVAFCVMAGGMATRMGGVVKALVEAFDGRTFLDLRLQ